MVTIRICTQQQGITEIKAQGHSGYAAAGHDIVCAGVSALMQTLVLGLKECLKLKPEVEQREGYLRCRLTTKSEQAQLLFAVFTLGLRQMAAAYSDYLQIVDSAE